VSNWTAAALIVGTGAATVALAHQAFPVAAPTAGAASVTTGASSAVVVGRDVPDVRDDGLAAGGAGGGGHRDTRSRSSSRPGESPAARLTSLSEPAQVPQSAE
jgi:hypothetical protein